MKKTTAIIPVAGAGMGLRPHTFTRPKPLIPVAGKPILGHIVDGLLDAGIDDMVFVIGQLGSKIQAYIERQYGSNFNYRFVKQENRMGTGHAIWLCKDLIDPGQEVLILLGDSIIDIDISTFLATEGSIVGVQPVPNPGDFGVVGVDSEGYVKSVVEKPKIPKSNLALVGLYKIAEADQLMHDLDELLEYSRHGQVYHLTTALQSLVHRGVRIRTQTVTNWYDCGRKEVLLETNRILLNRQNTQFQDYPGSIILPPVHIAPGVIIEDSVVGPYVAIGENAAIRRSILSDCIIGAFATLDHIVLSQSLVGNDSSVTGRHTSLNIGDNTEIDLNN